MPIRLLILALVACSFFLFYRKKLQYVVRPGLVLPTSIGLTIISLHPVGWMISLGIIYALPKFLNKKNPTHSKICAKCGTLSKQDDVKCRKCNNKLT